MTGSGGVPQDVHVDIAAVVPGRVRGRARAVDMQTVAACQKLSRWITRGIGRSPAPRQGWTRSVPLLRWLRREFRADRGRGVLFAHVLEDPQGFLEPGPCLGFAAEFA